MVVGLLAAVAVARATGPEHEAPPPPPPAEDASIEFLNAWARSRTTTYAAEGVFTRTLDGEPALEADVRTAQRPPDRLEVLPGSASGRSQGRRLACAAVEGGELSCRLGRDVGPYEEAVAREVLSLRQEVVGEDRRYDVTADGDCFVLTLVRSGTGAPYGTRAEFCFDPASGALTSSRVERGRAVDTVEMGPIRTEVTDEELGGGTGQG